MVIEAARSRGQELANLTLLEAQHMGTLAVEDSVSADSTIRMRSLGQIGSKPWLGSVSTKTMLTSGFTNISTLQEAFGRSNEFYVPANMEAPIRCVDGRYADEPESGYLGPQVAGATAGLALSSRIVEGGTSTTLVDDSDEVAHKLRKDGLVPGGHYVCGALMLAPKIVDIMTSRAFRGEQKHVLSKVHGTGFKRGVFPRLMSSVSTLKNHSDSYFAEREKSLEDLEDFQKDSVVRLNGDHQEGFVFFNTVEGTTFDSNAFSKEFGIQAFNYDIWFPQVAAASLYTSKEADKKQRLSLVNDAFTTAALIGLTDGSQIAGIREKVAA